MGNLEVAYAKKWATAQPEFKSLSVDFENARLDFEDGSMGYSVSGKRGVETGRRPLPFGERNNKWQGYKDAYDKSKGKVDNYYKKW